MNTSLLETIGFTKGEVKVYFALLELGNTSSGPIINTSKVSRSKVYDILEKLKQKGLVTESIKENIKYFQAASPERILDYIANKQKQIKKEEQAFKKILPELLQKQKKEEKQEAKIYLGYEGVKTFYNEILKEAKKDDEYLAMTFSEKALENKSLILFFRKFHQKRAFKKIKAKILSNQKKLLSKKGMDFSNTKFYEFRNTTQVLPTGIAIIGDKVATFNWGKIPRVFVIICKENADQYKKFFYDVWRRSK